MAGARHDRGASAGSDRRLAAIGLGIVALALVVSVLPGPAAAQQGGAGGGPAGFGEIQPIPPIPSPAPSPALAPLPEVPGSSRAPGAPAPGGSPAAKKKARGTAISPLVIVVLGVGVLVIVATILVVLAVVLKSPVVINVTSRSGGGVEGPPPADWIEGDLVRMGRPPEGTLKILPGRFVIDDGDRQIELRIFRTSGQDRVETTIGREVGQPYRHIQLKPLSVSARHAKLVFENGVYSVINYSRTNPTSVNGEPLPEGASRRLVDEDRIEIGEVVLAYHEI